VECRQIAQVEVRSERGGGDSGFGDAVPAEEFEPRFELGFVGATEGDMVQPDASLSERLGADVRILAQVDRLAVGRHEDLHGGGIVDFCDEGQLQQPGVPIGAPVDVSYAECHVVKEWCGHLVCLRSGLV